MKKTVTFREYEDAKLEIISGVEYKEYSEMKEDGRFTKQYATENNGTFYEVTDNGITEFWSDKHSASRYYDSRSREEIIDQYEDIISKLQKENARMAVERGEYRRSMNDNGLMVIALRKKVKELEEKLAAINALVAA